MSSDFTLIPEQVIERSPINYDDPYIAYDERNLGILNVHSEIWRYTRMLPDVCLTLYMIILHDTLDIKRPRSITELAEAAGKSRSTVIEGIRALEYVNMIQVRRDTERHTMQKKNNGYYALPAHRWKLLDHKYNAKNNPASAASKSTEISRSKNWTSDSPKIELKNNTIQDSGDHSFTTLQSDHQRNAPLELPASVQGDTFVDVKEKTEIPSTKELAVTPLATLPLFAESTVTVPAAPELTPVTKKEVTQTSPALVNNFTPAAGMLVWYQPTREKTAPPIPALVIKVRKHDAVIAHMSHGQIVDQNAAFSRLKERAGADEHDAALQTYAQEKLTAAKEHAQRADLMDAWKKATEGVYGATGFEIGPLLRAKGGIFGQLLKLNLTPDQVKCAGALYKAWWDMQKPVVKVDIGSLVLTIKTAVNLCERKYTPENVRVTMNTIMLEPFWKGKPISFDQMVSRITTLVTAPGNHNDKPKAKLNNSDMSYGVWLREQILKVEDGQTFDTDAVKYHDRYVAEMRDLISRGYQIPGRVPKVFRT